MKTVAYKVHYQLSQAWLTDSATDLATSQSTSVLVIIWPEASYRVNPSRQKPVSMDMQHIVR